jgi:pimeloyl-ACP methyl ester carboxylesterase
VARAASAHSNRAHHDVRSASHRGLRDDDLAVLVDPWTGEEGQPAFYRQIAQADERYTDEVEPRYGTLDEPTHIVWGAEDRWLPVEQAGRLRAAVPGATLTVLPDAGHLVQLDAPVALTAEITRWTEHVRQAAAGTA